MFIKFYKDGDRAESFDVDSIEFGTVAIAEHYQHGANIEIVLILSSGNQSYVEGNKRNIEAFKELVAESATHVLFRTPANENHRAHGSHSLAAQDGYILLKKDKIVSFQDGSLMVDFNKRNENRDFERKLSVIETHDEIEDIIVNKSQYKPKNRSATPLQPFVTAVPKVKKTFK